MANDAGSFNRLLHQLPVQGRVLYLAAHPDDENTRLITYLAKEKGFETAYLSLTRGDGGQNLIGNETGEKLGLIRTQELAMARSIDGGKQFFTRAFDFGYSKSPEETFKFWNKDSLLADVVFIVRHFQPDIIILRFPTTGEGGHGHHTASAILGVEAFTAAANPNRFPEQLTNGLKPWQAKRIYWNVFNWQNASLDGKGYNKINVGGYDALTGFSNGEIAATSRTMHQSQGFGSSKSRGNQFEYLQLLDGTATNNPFEDMEVSFGKLTEPARKQIEKIHKQIVRQYKPEEPAVCLPLLAQMKTQLMQLKYNDASTQSLLSRVEALILMAIGWYAEATVTKPLVALKDSINVHLHCIARLSANPILKQIRYNHQVWAKNSNLETNVLTSFILPIFVENDKLDNPYWLAHARSPGFFQITDAQNLLIDANTAPQKLSVTLELDKILLNIDLPIQYKKVEPAGGELFKPLFAVPDFSITPKTDRVFFINKEPKTLQFEVRRHKKGALGVIRFEAKGFEFFPESISLESTNALDVWDIQVQAVPKEKEGLVNLQLKFDNKQLAYQLKEIQYKHIPQQYWQMPTKLVLQNLDVKIANKNLLYLPGAGDECADVLSQIGFNIKTISLEDLKEINIHLFPALLVGVRALNIADNPKQTMQALLDFTAKGGTVVLQYQTTSANMREVTNWPAGFNLSRLRVTEEEAKPTFLLPEHPILQTPNLINEADFEGWVQERGLYFLDKWADNAMPIISWHDEGEQPLAGSLVAANHGKGVFIYAGISWFRQLPAGVSGSIKLLINSLSYKQK